jgi:hypothetical protein
MKIYLSAYKRDWGTFYFEFDSEQHAVEIQPHYCWSKEGRPGKLIEAKTGEPCDPMLDIKIICLANPELYMITGRFEKVYIDRGPAPDSAQRDVERAPEEWPKIK